jgi:peroxiredoxin Q/BCP
MAQLRQDYQKFVELNAVVVVVGPENADAFKRYWQKESLPFIGVSDPGHTVLKLYGQEVNLFKLGRMPAQVLIDRAGMVRFVHYGHSMEDIPPNEEVLALLGEMNSEQPRQ